MESNKEHSVFCFIS